jgi:hypothetical protein
MSMDEAKAAVAKTKREHAEVLANQERVDEIIKRLSSMMRHPTNSQAQR